MECNHVLLLNYVLDYQKEKRNLALRCVINEEVISRAHRNSCVASSAGMIRIRFKELGEFSGKHPPQRTIYHHILSSPFPDCQSQTLYPSDSSLPARSQTQLPAVDVPDMKQHVPVGIVVRISPGEAGEILVLIAHGHFPENPPSQIEAVAEILGAGKYEIGGCDITRINVDAPPAIHHVLFLPQIADMLVMNKFSGINQATPWKYSDG